MRHVLLLLICTVLLGSCNSVRRNEKLLSRGNYDQALELAIKKIANNRDAEATDQHKLLLAEAFTRAVERDLRTIRKLERSGGLDTMRRVYYTYLRLDNRQERIRPLLPLRLQENDRLVDLDLTDHSVQLRNARERFAQSLLRTAKDYLDRGNKPDARFAYELLDELRDLQPHDREVADLLEEARYRGTDFVLVQLNNRSNQIIPGPLEEQLLDFNTYGLDDFWTQYHRDRQPGVAYDFGINLNFRLIEFSPESVYEKEERRTRRVKDGWDYKKDRNGNIVEDANGEAVKIDRFRTVSAVLRITEQHKAVRMAGQVAYWDLRDQRLMDRHPLGNEFVFHNLFATFSGDERALSDEDLALTQNRFIPFPGNAQLLLNSGEELKARLSEILRQL